MHTKESPNWSLIILHGRVTYTRRWRLGRHIIETELDLGNMWSNLNHHILIHKLQARLKVSFCGCFCLVVGRGKGMQRKATIWEFILYGNTWNKFWILSVFFFFLHFTRVHSFVVWSEAECTRCKYNVRLLCTLWVEYNRELLFSSVVVG